MNKAPWYQPYAGWMRVTKQEYDLVQGEGTMESLRRFRWVVCLMVPLHLVMGFLLGRYRAPADHPELQAWAATVGPAHWSAALLAAIGGVAAHYVLRHARASATAIALQILVSVGYIYLGAYLSIADLVANAGAGLSSFMLICIMFGVLSLMRPAISVPLFLGTYLVFAYLLRHAPIPPQHNNSLNIVAFFCPLLALVASLMVWSQFAKAVKLRRQLSRSNQALVAQQRELAFLADHDTLTGLYNRREFMRQAQQELNRAVRAGVPTHCVMVDLDFFKKVNDLHGHPVGDAMLQHVAAVLLRGVRSTDTVARLGGEEFIVLLPDTARQGACDVAEKLRLLLRSSPLVYLGVELPMTASMGVSGTTPGQKASVGAIYAAADRALYVAKQLGRDQVQYASPEASELAAPSD
ncbi:GGDEF domain-containing protein [Rhodoferax sp.]|uniref:GGDEF domain-containing protein n=1 Tax=Rhodoferax sp. TaxID=50421 RepID=UPI002ACD8823|nr:GGDEF domain-containing protein [Rhodoferax sp.]MDZ7922372.1 GGDEF domain-containing protein [Rhodoferax sp.]